MIKSEENKEVQRFKEMQSKVVVITTEDTQPVEKYFNKPDKSLKRKAQESPKEAPNGIEAGMLNVELIPIEAEKKKTDEKEKPPEPKKVKAMSELVADYSSDSGDDDD